eukprot:gene2835-4242_t
MYCPFDHTEVEKQTPKAETQINSASAKVETIQAQPEKTCPFDKKDEKETVEKHSLSCRFDKVEKKVEEKKTCPFKDQTKLEDFDVIKKILNKTELDPERCPFSEGNILEISKSCPAFQKEEGCLFKRYNTLDEIASLFDSIPEDHPKCSAFQENKQFFKQKLEEVDDEVLSVFLNRRWDVYFDEPLRKEKLSSALHKETKPNHIKAESVPFIKRFAAYDLDPKQYRRYLSQLYFVYQAIEYELEKNKDHPLLSKVYYPDQLSRVNALEMDLDYFYGNDFKKKIKMMETTRDYVNRIHEVGEKQPELLIAQAYTRYLGDLFGGQILKRCAKKALKLDKKGYAFYEFPYISSIKSFRDGYKADLDDLNVTIKKLQEIVDEANFTFTSNIRMTTQLDEKDEEDDAYPLIPSSMKNENRVVIGMIGSVFTPLVAIVALIAMLYALFSFYEKTKIQ